MSIRCAIMQPSYIPWMGYFALADAVDVFILLDTVQLTKRNWDVRNRIKDAKGNELMLSVPIRKTRPREELLIRDALINDDMKWRRKHLASFQVNYRKAPWFDAAHELFAETLEKEINGHIARLNEAFFRDTCAILGIETRILRASDLPVTATGKARRLVELCKAVGAQTYVSAAGSAVYLEEREAREMFAEAGINIRYQDYRHPVYPQVNGPFLSHMSILDVLANTGPRKAAEHVRKGHREVASASPLGPGTARKENADE